MKPQKICLKSPGGRFLNHGTVYAWTNKMDHLKAKWGVK